LPSPGGQEDSRRAFLRTTVAAACLTALAPETFAAVPNMEEYNKGSGTVVRPPPGMGKAATKKVVAPTDKASALAAVDEADALLESFPPLCEKLAWYNKTLIY
jgi:hypothetical protein